jgi:hypothetical protein
MGISLRLLNLTILGIIIILSSFQGEEERAMKCPKCPLDNTVTYSDWSSLLEEFIKLFGF